MPFFAKTVRDSTQLCGFVCAPSSCCLAGAGTLAPGSIRRRESIAAVRFVVAIGVVDLSRCFCFAKTFVACYPPSQSFAFYVSKGTMSSRWELRHLAGSPGGGGDIGSCHTLIRVHTV